MLAKRPNLSEAEAAELLDLQGTELTDPVPEAGESVMAEPAEKAANNVIAVDFTRSVKSPHPTTWLDYEEFFPTADAEATEPIATLSPELLNRRCYWSCYWPKTQVFRIKDVDMDNNTVYLNIVYRWVSAPELMLLKADKPQRPPKEIELACGDLPF